MSTSSRILQALKKAPASLDDDELAQALGVVRQQINQSARSLEASKKLIRVNGPSGKLVNIVNDRKGRRLASTMAKTIPMIREGINHLSEDEVKQAVHDHLIAQGYEVEVAWDRSRGIDIEARRGKERLVVEAKGEVSLQAQQHNYFVNALGELVQRMDDPSARYGLALPNHRQYHGLVERLPQVAKERLDFIVFWVERGPDGPRVTTDLPPANGRGPGRTPPARHSRVRPCSSETWNSDQPSPSIIPRYPTTRASTSFTAPLRLDHSTGPRRQALRMWGRPTLV